MNVRPDAMLRHQGMPPLSQNMLTMNSQQFMQSQQNHPQTQQFSPSHMNGLVPIPSANPPMALIAGQPQAITPAQRYQLQLNQATDRKRQQVLLQQAQAAQGLNPSGGGGGAPGQGPMQNMAFPSTMMPQQPGNPQLRRVASQPTPLNQSGAIHPGQGGGMSMGMNPQTSMPAHLRQAHQQQQHLQQQQQQQQHQQQQLRMQQQQQQQMQGHMPPDMAIALGHRQPMPLNMNRSASAQAHLVATMPQNNFQNPMSLVQQQAPSSSPRPGGSHSQPHTPSNIMTTPVPGHGSAGRPQMTPDNPMFMNFQNQQNQLQNYNANRMPSGNNPQFFVPSSVSPNNPIDGLSSLPDGMGNGGRQNFLSTPAQQMEQMRQGNEGFAPHYGMPPPHSNAPPRPPSHNTQHPPAPLGSQPQQPHQHHSPHSSEHGIGHHRPPSQPQGQPVRPSSQAGLSLTPRGMHAQLPGNGSLLPAARIPGPASSQHPGSHIIPPSAPNHSVPVAPRPPTQPQPVAGPSTAPAHSMPTPQSEIAANHAALLAQQRPGVPSSTFPVGLGQGLVRLLQFSGILASKHKAKLQLSYWDQLVKEYFTPKAMMKFTLWKDNQRNEAKPFEIGVPILPRFFLVTSQAGVDSMTLSLDGARERLLNPGHAVVECVTAVWTYKYTNGYTVTLRGPLTAHVLLVPHAAPSAQQAAQNLSYSLKFENLQFDANFHDKYIALESVMGQRVMESPRMRNAPTPTASGTAAQQRAEDKKWEEPRVTIERASIPGEPVNAFGIPQATMRCLELAESVGQMTDLISFSNEHQLGPLEALNKFAGEIRKKTGQPIPTQTAPPFVVPGPSNPGALGSYSNFSSANGAPTTPANSLYPNTPASANPPTSSNPQAAPATASPKTEPTTSADHSPRKQNKTIPQPAQSTAPTTAPPAGAGPSPATTTPSAVTTSLKRKQAGDTTASPTTANSDQPPPAKRVTRKRGRTTGGG